MQSPLINGHQGVEPLLAGILAMNGCAQDQTTRFSTERKPKHSMLHFHPQTSGWQERFLYSIGLMYLKLRPPGYM